MTSIYWTIHLSPNYKNIKKNKSIGHEKENSRVMGRVGYSPTNNFDGFFCLAFTTVQLNPFTTATLGTDKK